MKYLIQPFLIFESLAKVKKIISNNTTLDTETEAIVDKIYEKLNDYQIAKPIYVDWVLKLIMKNDIKNTDFDLNYVSVYLKIYNNHLNSIPQKYHLYNKGEKRFYYENLGDFVEMLDRVLVHISDFKILYDKNNDLGNDTRVLYDNNKWYVIHLKNYSAVEYYCSGSEWCVTSLDNYEEYKEGDLIMIMNKTLLGTNKAEKKYLMYIKDDAINELRDYEDHYDYSLLSEPEIRDLFKEEIDNTTEFDLSGLNHNGKNYFRVIQSVKGLKYLPSVENINISYNKLNDENFKEIMKMIAEFNVSESVKIINCDLNLDINDIDFISDISLPNLNELYITNISTNKINLDLKNFKELTTLYLRSGRITNASIKSNTLKVLNFEENYLEEIPDLETPNLLFLSLDYNNIETLDTNKFSKTQKLSILKIGGNNIKSVIYDEKVKLNWEELTISALSCKKEDKKCYLDIFKNVKVLNIRDVKKDDDKTQPFFEDYENLNVERFVIYSSKIKDFKNNILKSIATNNNAVDSMMKKNYIENFTDNKLIDFIYLSFSSNEIELLKNNILKVRNLNIYESKMNRIINLYLKGEKVSFRYNDINYMENTIIEYSKNLEFSKNAIEKINNLKIINKSANKKLEFIIHQKQYAVETILDIKNLNLVNIERFELILYRETPYKIDINSESTKMIKIYNPTKGLKSLYESGSDIQIKSNSLEELHMEGFTPKINIKNLPNLKMLELFLYKNNSNKIENDNLETLIINNIDKDSDEFFDFVLNTPNLKSLEVSYINMDIAKKLYLPKLKYLKIRKKIGDNNYRSKVLKEILTKK